MIYNALQEPDHININPNLHTLLKVIFFEAFPANRTSLDTLVSYYFPVSFPSFQRKKQFWKLMEALMLYKLHTVSTLFFFPFVSTFTHVITSVSSNVNNTRILLQATNKLREIILKTTRNKINFPHYCLTTKQQT
jgi:hypothetical protein